MVGFEPSAVFAGSDVVRFFLPLAALACAMVLLPAILGRVLGLFNRRGRDDRDYASRAQAFKDKHGSNYYG